MATATIERIERGVVGGAPRAATSTESAVIGALLMDSVKAWPHVQKAALTSNAFSDARCRVLFSIIEQDATKRGPEIVSLERVHEAVQRQDGLDIEPTFTDSCADAYGGTCATLPTFIGELQAHAAHRRAASVLKDAASDVEHVKPDELPAFIARMQADLRDATPEPVHSWMESALTASTIGALSLPEARYLVPGVLPEGLSILAGKPKLGKSWLSLDIGLAVASGGVAVGQLPVERGDVLLLALEDGTRRMQSRLRRLLPDGQPPENMSVFFDWPRTDAGGLDRIGQWLDKNCGCRLVIIDTLAKVKAQGRFTQNAYEADYAALEGLQRMAVERGVAILLVHHLRKMAAADALDTVSGSTGITGCSDAICILERGRGEADAVLSVTGRDISESQLALRFDAGRWSLLGDAQEHAVSETRRTILDALAIQPMTPKEISEATGLPVNSVRVTLHRMADAVSRGADGHYTTHRNAVMRNAPITAISPLQHFTITEDGGFDL